jgi:cardiolipin synthase (CMP-forming)
VTLANKITIGRILLIPVFVSLAIYYGESCRAGQPDERWRYAAVATFLTASVTDALDGWIARRFNQRSRLGTILDPIADKGLLLSAIITLSLSPWPERFPLWFPLLIITKDVLSILGAFLIDRVAGQVTLRPHWTGKITTVLQMTALGWLMLQISWLPLIIPVAAAGIFTFISGMVYLADGVRQLHASGSGDPDQRT